MQNPSIYKITSNSNFILKYETFRNIIIAFIGLILSVLAAFFWQGEEPSKLHTYIVSMCIYFLCAFLITHYLRINSISLPWLWFLSFGFKLILTVFITYYAWFEPLTPELLRVREVVRGAQDSNLYDYYGLQAAKLGILSNWDLLNFTWQSVGITGYIAVIYKYIGYSIVYVSMCNAAMSLVGFIMLCRTLNKIFGPSKIWNFVVLGMFIPSLAFYDATPAKEPLTHALFYTTLYFIVDLFSRPLVSWKKSISVILSFCALLLIRTNVAILLIISNILPVIRRIGLIKFILFFLCLTSITVAFTISYTGSAEVLKKVLNINMTSIKESNDFFIQIKKDAGDSSQKIAVANYLNPSNLFQLIAFAPIRSFIWILLPYPYIIPSFKDLTLPPTLYYEKRIDKVLAFNNQSAILRSWLVIAEAPFLLGLLFAATKKKAEGFQLIIVNIIIPLLVIANLMFVMGRRYQILLDPLLLAGTLIAIRYKFGYKFIGPIYFVASSGVLIFYLTSRY